MDEISNTVRPMLQNQTGEGFDLYPDPELGYTESKPDDVLGGSPKENARDLLQIFIRKVRKDLVIINAAAALGVSDCEFYTAGYSYAEDAIDSGKSWLNSTSLGLLPQGFTGRAVR